MTSSIIRKSIALCLMAMLSEAPAVAQFSAPVFDIGADAARMAEVARRRAAEQSAAREEAKRRARRSAEVKEQVGLLVKQGKCQEAIDFALAQGEVESANAGKADCAM